MHNKNNKPPDNGQPCRIPDLHHIESVIELFISILNVAFKYIHSFDPIYKSKTKT